MRAFRSLGISMGGERLPRGTRRRDDGAVPTQPPRRPPTPLARRVVMSLAVAAAIGGLVFVATAPKQDTGPSKPSAVEAVYPQGGDLDLRQVTILADLAPGYTGGLLIDGREVVEDDLQHVDALNQVILKPKPESDYLHLAPGNHCATVVYRKFGEPLEVSESYRWCFILH